MALIQDLLLRFKTQGTESLKAIKTDVSDLKKDVENFSQVGGPFGNTINGIVGKLGPMGLAASAAGSALALLGGRAVQIAGDLTDIADATGVSAGALLNFKQSVTDAGGSADGFSKMVSKLSVSIGEANNGNEKFQKSFKELGVTVRDANGNLRPTETILQDVLASISGITDPAIRAARAVELLGKEAAKIDLTNLNAASDAETTRYIANLDKVNQAVDRIRNNLERKVVNLFGGAIDAFNRSQEIADRAEAAANERGKTIVRDPRLGTAMEVDMTERQKRNYQLNKTIEAGEADHQREMSRLRKMGATASAAGGDFGGRSEAQIKSAEDSARRVQLSILEAEKATTTQGLAEIARIRRNAEYDIQKEIINIRSNEKLTGAEKASEIAAKTAEIRAKANSQVSDVLERQKTQVSNINSEFIKQQTILQNRLDLETELVGKSAEQAEQIRAQRQLALDYLSAQEQLIKQRDSLAAGETAQAQRINQLIKQNAEAYGEQSQALERSITSQQTAKILEQDRLDTIERITKAYEQQQRIQETLADAQRSIISQRQEVDFEGAQQGASPMQRQIAQIKESSRRAALEASRAFAAAFEDTGDGMSAERAKQLSDGLELIRVGYQGITDAQVKNLEASRTWNAGWKAAFEEYAENANNAAAQSRSYFETFTKGFEDAFVKFVQTGKLSFKDLANSMIADFARVQAKRALLGMFSGGGGGGILGSIGKIFGFANGGNPAIGNPILVGEKGPELMIPRNASTIIPNSQLGGSSNQTSVTYNIQAVDAQSFQSMLARDPGFLHAVAEKGRRSMPQGVAR